MVNKSVIRMQTSHKNWISYKSPGESFPVSVIIFNTIGYILEFKESLLDTQPDGHMVNLRKRTTDCRNLDSHLGCAGCDIRTNQWLIDWLQAYYEYQISYVQLRSSSSTFLKLHYLGNSWSVHWFGYFSSSCLHGALYILCLCRPQFLLVLFYKLIRRLQIMDCVKRQYDSLIDYNINYGFLISASI